MSVLAFIEKSQGEYWDRLNAGVYDTAKRRGDEVRIYAPTAVDPPLQLECLRQAISSHPDALVVVASDPVLFGEEIERAINSGIPVLTMDLDGYEKRRLFHFGTLPFTELGRIAAEEMLKRLEGNGPVIVQAGSNAPGASGKLKGFCDRMREAGRRIVVIDPDFENPDLALIRVLKAIEENPDVAGLHGVYAYHCIVQAKAVELSGRQPGSVPIVGFDMLDDTVKRLSDGSISASIWIREYYFGAAAAMAAGLFATCRWDEVIAFLGGSERDLCQNIRRLPAVCYSKDNIQCYMQWLKEHE